MSEATLEKLTETLTGDLEPVKPLRHPAIRLLPWLALILAYVVADSFFLVLRADLSEKLAQSVFLFEIGLSLLLAVSAALTAAYLSVPDMRGMRWLTAVPLSLFAVFLLFLSTQIYSTDLAMFHSVGWHDCFSDSLIMGAAPVALMVFMTRGGTTTRPFLSALMNILAVGGLGWLAMRLVCEADNVAHVAAHHFMPFVVLGTLLGLLARRLYKW